jgi:hypothetical protein
VIDEDESDEGIDGAVVSGMTANVAVTVVFDVMDTVHVPVPEHPPPDQPENDEPDVGVAVRVILVPVVTVDEQVEPQEIPVPDTVPDPAPVLAVVRVYVAVTFETVIDIEEEMVELPAKSRAVAVSV